MQVIVKIMTYHFDHYSLFITFNFTFLFIFYGFFDRMDIYLWIERPIFQNFKITNIQIAKDELFDHFIYEFIYYYYFSIT